MLGVDDLHRAMLRKVGGFDAIRELLAIFQATAHHQFWVVSMHSHAFQFLNGAAAPVNIGLFSRVIPVGDLTSEKMSHWLQARVKDAGYSLSYSRLVQQQGDSRMLQRAATAYWRLLTDESGGNPAVAEAQFSQALALSDEEKVLAVQVLPPLDEDLLTELNDTERFTLTSLFIHDGLDVFLLSRVLEIPMSRVRSACQHLLSLRIIEQLGSTYVVALSWQPHLTKHLHQRRLLVSG